MIKKVSTRNKDVEKEIEELVGKSYSLMERLKMGGNGSPRLIVVDASNSIKELFEKDSYRNVCNIELRPGGIVVGFRAKLETYAWCIPYYKLLLFQNENNWKIYSGTEKIAVQNYSKKNVAFFRKLLEEKSNFITSEKYIDHI